MNNYNIEFEKAIKFVLKWEGGYSNDPNDSGGETKYGISKKSYPNLDIKNLTIEKAKEIYYRDYWLKANCDKLFSPLNIIVFDTAVNCGRSRANEFLISSLGWQDYLFRRIGFYAGLKNAKYYLRGWVNRIIDLYNLIKK